jgi:hypothetical protein
VAIGEMGKETAMRHNQEDLPRSTTPSNTEGRPSGKSKLFAVGMMMTDPQLLLA